MRRTLEYTYTHIYIYIIHAGVQVRRTLDFRWRHLSYIEQYIVKPSGGNNSARGTGGTHALHYLQQHINDTEDSLIHIHYDDGDSDGDGDDGSADGSGAVLTGAQSGVWMLGLVHQPPWKDIIWMGTSIDLR